jgi:starvation-inducible DNA-binding protein
MHSSPNPLPTKDRSAVCKALLTVLTDGLDLYSQIKVAHWNIKGPHFTSLHPLFDTFATQLGDFNDAVAERVLTLGGLAVGTARHVASKSSLPDYPQDVTRDLEHVKLLIERIDAFLKQVRTGRELADEHDDQDTVDQLTEIVQVFEKHAWFLRATLDR